MCKNINTNIIEDLCVVLAQHESDFDICISYGRNYSITFPSLIMHGNEIAKGLSEAE